MNDILPFALKCALSLGISAVVIRILLRHLRGLLLRLCPDEAAAAFWLDYTRLSLALAPLVLLIIADWLLHDADAMNNLRISLLSILGGLLLGLFNIKRHIDRFIAAPGKLPETAASQEHAA